MLQQVADLILVVDRAGVLLEVEHQDARRFNADLSSHIGEPLINTMTVESEKKISELLLHKQSAPSRFRQVNHVVEGGDDIPVRYSAMPVNSKQILLVGQSLVEIASTQQLLMRTQRALENDFASLSQAKARYQMLLELSNEAVVDIDVTTGKIVNANAAAQRLLGRFITPLKGAKFPQGFDKPSTKALEELMVLARTKGRAADLAVTAVDKSSSFLASASLIQDVSGSTLMLRFTPMTESHDDISAASLNRWIKTIFSDSPDAVVVCDNNGNVITANDALASMTQVASVDQLVGKPVDNWLGRSSLDHRLLNSNLKEHGEVPKFSTIVSSDHGVNIDVEISAATINHEKLPYTLLIIRNVQSRLNVNEDIVAQTPGAPLKDLVGRVPLKELVRESTDLIEKLCIESALEMTSDNRASAAEMLGLSRQSLYTKLHRFGIADGSDNNSQ